MLPLLVMEGAGFMPDRSGLRAYCPNDIAIAELGTQKYTREFPVAKFFHKRGYKRRMSGYFARIESALDTLGSDSLKEDSTW